MGALFAIGYPRNCLRLWECWTRVRCLAIRSSYIVVTVAATEKKILGIFVSLTPAPCSNPFAVSLKVSATSRDLLDDRHAISTPHNPMPLLAQPPSFALIIRDFHYCPPCISYHHSPRRSRSTNSRTAVATWPKPPSNNANQRRKPSAM